MQVLLGGHDLALGVRVAAGAARLVGEDALAGDGTERRGVGRVAEVGDGVARVEGGLAVRGDRGEGYAVHRAAEDFGT